MGRRSSESPAGAVPPPLAGRHTPGLLRPLAQACDLGARSAGGDPAAAGPGGTSVRLEPSPSTLAPLCREVSRK